MVQNPAIASLRSESYKKSIRQRITVIFQNLEKHLYCWIEKPSKRMSMPNSMMCCLSRTLSSRHYSMIQLPIYADEFKHDEIWSQVSQDPTVAVHPLQRLPMFPVERGIPCLSTHWRREWFAIERKVPFI